MSNNFYKGCTLDHEKKITDLLSDKGVQGIEKLGKLIGNQQALDYFEKIITNHKECLNSNHDRLQQKKKDVVI